MKVLIVDDAEIDSLLCQKTVENLGYRPIAVSSASEALEIIQKPGAPDIIILDWFMPETTGIELCEAIRNSDLMVEPFILMMTGNADRHAEAEALNAGADDFISKPINKIDIEAKLSLGRRLIKTQLELLVANQKLSEKLQFDAVTGIMTRQPGLRAITASLSRLSRQDKNQGLFIHCHIRLNTASQNRFKHDVYDRFYFDLTRSLAKLLRQSDVMVRFRDDELLFYAESLPESHQMLIDRIEKAIEECEPEQQAMKLALSPIIAGLTIKAEQAMVDVDQLLQQTEALLSKLHKAGEVSALEPALQGQSGRVIDFSVFRQSQRKA